MNSAEELSFGIAAKAAKYGEDEVKVAIDLASHNRSKWINLREQATNKGTLEFEARVLQLAQDILAGRMPQPIKDEGPQATTASVGGGPKIESPKADSSAASAAIDSDHGDIDEDENDEVWAAIESAINLKWQSNWIGFAIEDAQFMC